MLAKTIAITGATSGIGTETALALAKQGHTIYMLVRDVQKGERLKNAIMVETGNTNIHVVECDLADLGSVHRAADELKAKLVNIQVLINNAGGIVPTRELSKDGFELTFAFNHLGHFLLTLSLMPLLEKGQARVINVSSEAHRMAKVNFEDLQSEKDYSGLTVYGNAKLFNIYFTQSIAERYANKGVTAYSLHPGVVNTGFGSQYSGFMKTLLSLARPFMVSPKKGARTSVFLATAPKIEPLSGKYFKKEKETRSSAVSYDDQARQDLWLASEVLVKYHML